MVFTHVPQPHPQIPRASCRHRAHAAFVVQFSNHDSRAIGEPRMAAVRSSELQIIDVCSVSNLNAYHNTYCRSLRKQFLSRHTSNCMSGVSVLGSSFLHSILECAILFGQRRNDRYCSICSDRSTTMIFSREARQDTRRFRSIRRYTIIETNGISCCFFC